MGKLTIEHLAKHLPYGLKILRPDNRTILEVIGFHGDSILVEDAESVNYCSIDGVVPILRPLSDLIEKDVTPFDICWMQSGLRFENYWIKGNNIELSYYIKVHNWLLGHHYDIDNLIEKGLAIDINSLKENPYK